mgnify:CR=1 FL=1
MSGFGTLADRWPWFAEVMRFGGAAFLVFYGLRSFHSAWAGGERLEAAGQGRARQSQA